MKKITADDAEFDIRFLVRKFNVKSLEIVDPAELKEVQKIINNVK